MIDLRVTIGKQQKLAGQIRIRRGGFAFRRDGEIESGRPLAGE